MRELLVAIFEINLTQMVSSKPMKLVQPICVAFIQRKSSLGSNPFLKDSTFNQIMNGIRRMKNIEGMIVDYKGEIEHLSNSMIDEQAKPVYQKRIDFLNRLKTYYPQSYNDDAQKKIDDAIYLIEHYASHGHDKNLREKVVSGLKSLRPSWKPSEEQN